MLTRLSHCATPNCFKVPQMYCSIIQQADTVNDWLIAAQHLTSKMRLESKKKESKNYMIYLTNITQRDRHILYIQTVRLT